MNPFITFANCQLLLSAVCWLKNLVASNDT